MTNLNVKLNLELNGVEVYFESKPDTKTLNYLKNNKFRWHRVKKCWYSKNGKESQKIIKDIRKGNIPEVEELQIKKNNEEKLDISIIDDPDNAYLGGHGWYGVNSKKDYNIKDINKICKTELKKQNIKIQAQRKNYNSFYVQIFMDKNDIKTFEEFKKDFFRGYMTKKYYVKVNGKDVNTYHLTKEEEYQLLNDDNVKYENYEVAKRELNDYIFNEKGMKKIEKVEQFYNSFNYDYSNAMVDYFHKRFYLFITYKMEVKK